MPIFSLQPGLPLSRRGLLLAGGFFAAAWALPFAPGQTLARPGWVGSGLTASVWWQHAILYAAEADSGSGWKALAGRMEGLRELGIDAVLLRGVEVGDGAGAMEDFDELLSRASRNNLRVLVELRPKTMSEDVSGVARFWLSRGVAGLRLVEADTAQGDSAQVRQLRTVARGYVGERVVIGDAGGGPVAAGGGAVSGHDYSVATARGRSVSKTRKRRGGAAVREPGRGSMRAGDGPQLVVGAAIGYPFDVGAIRMALEKNDALSRSGAVPLLTTVEDDAIPAEAGRVVAALVLSSRGGAILREGEDSPELADWYRQLIAMRRSGATARTGADTMLIHDEQRVVAWVRRPAVVSMNAPAVVYVCNLSEQAVTLSLRADMQRLQLKGSFLRTVLRSDTGMGSMGLDEVKLAPLGVYVGELRY